MHRVPKVIKDGGTQKALGHFAYISWETPSRQNPNAIEHQKNALFKLQCFVGALKMCSSILLLLILCRSGVGLKKKAWPRKELNYWQKLPLFPIPTLAPNWKRSSRKMRAKIPDPKSEKNPKGNGMISWTKSRKAKATNEKTPRPNWKKSKAKFLQISNHQNSFAQIVTKPDQPHLIVQVVPMAFWVNLRGWAAGKVPHWLLDLQGERRHSISIFYRLGLCFS